MTGTLTLAQLPQMSASQLQKEVTFNEAMLRLGTYISGVLSLSVTAPPGSPADGSAYIVPADATGVWAAHGDELAVWSSGWRYLMPFPGLALWVADEAAPYRYVDGSPGGWEIAGDLATTAEAVVFSPYEPADWGGLPTQVAEALDELAARVKVLEESGGGGGGGPWRLVFQPRDNEPPTANFATIDTRNSHPVLDFDASTQETAIFTGVLPDDYAGGGITVSAHWAATSATTGTIGWDISVERIGAVQDLDSDGFATAQVITAITVPGTSGLVAVSSVNIADGADMDSLAAGELFRLRVRRDVASDTATGDAELVAVEIVEQ